MWPGPLTRSLCVFSSTTAIHSHQSTPIARGASWQHNTVSTQALGLFQINLLSRLMVWKLPVHNSQSRLWHLSLPSVSLLQGEEVLQESRLCHCFIKSSRNCCICHEPFRRGLHNKNETYFCQVVFLDKFTRSSTWKITAEGWFE